MLNKNAMEPGECTLCGAKALRWPKGQQPEDWGSLFETDWKHAGRPTKAGIEQCVIISRGSYMPQRDLDMAFKPTPGVEVEQFEVRYFAPRAYHVYGSNPGGFAGSMVIGDREEAERNADTSTNGTDSVYVYRVVNGVTEPKACYVGKWEASA
ncbi:hypothetical protein [Streptomyces sp. Wb2n-11]|uniref:hypothetical protein n=1 Tax=Streptomyces sp. Wb2n-11 TaxID=1030533 RepID=UPI000AEF0FAE|nr:hypothetical protein [Streptomyces sp. Wb2n-11]